MKKIRLFQAALVGLTILAGAVSGTESASAFIFNPVKFQKGRVPDTSLSPFSSVVFIVDELTGESGSGVLIAPDMVLTAAHVVLRNRAPQTATGGSHLWPRQLIEPSSMRILPAYGGIAGPEAVRYPYGYQYRGQSVSVRADYFDQALRPEGDAGDNDLALIRLNMPVFGADVLPLAEFWPQDVNREVVSAVGFPSNLGYGHNGGPANDNDNMYVDYGTIEAMTNRQLLTQNVDWTNGQSGGPILNSQNQVVGIISASNEYGNFATRIDADLNCWIQQQLTNHEEELAPSSARGRWRQLGNRRVYFDADGVAVRITTQRDGNDGEEPLDLSIPKGKNHTHDEL